MSVSKNDFFKQNKSDLIFKRDQLNYLLKIVWKRDRSIVDFYLEAYDYFVENPEQYDGATIVKDLNILPGLDIFAMIHDYMYIKYNVASNWYYKYLSDIIYAWEMERMGTSAYATWSRFIGLTIVIGLTFTPYRYVITGLRMNKTQKQTMKEIYKMFK